MMLWREEISLISGHGGTTSLKWALNLVTIQMPPRPGSLSKRQPWKSNGTFWRNKCVHYWRREKAFRSSSWHKILCWKLCPTQSLRMGSRSEMFFFDCSHPTTRSLCCIHPRSITSKWIYFARTIPDLEELFKPLEVVIRQHFLPSLTGQNEFNDANQDLMALPVHIEGLGIINPSHQCIAICGMFTMLYC